MRLKLIRPRGSISTSAQLVVCIRLYKYKVFTRRMKQRKDRQLQFLAAPSEHDRRESLVEGV